MATRIRPIKQGQARHIAALIGPQHVASVPAEVIQVTAGPVSLRQKVAGYYKGLVALVGTVLTLLTAPEIGALAPLLPAQYRHWLPIGIGVATVLLTFLTENQHWFDDAATGQG